MWIMPIRTSMAARASASASSVMAPPFTLSLACTPIHT